MLVVASLTAAAQDADKDASIISKARQLNEQWADFDKTGKYPEKANPGFHSTILTALTFIDSNSLSYSEAQALRPVFTARQMKIAKIEEAKNPVTASPEIKLGQVDKSYGLLKGSFVLTNQNPFPIADVRVACNVYGGSGTVIREYNFTVFEVVPAKGKKSVTGFNFGFWPDQGKKVGCSTSGFQKR